jgi:hypothetical protein
MLNHTALSAALYGTEFELYRRGKYPPEDVERWPEKLSNVLDTSQARHKFRIYLELKELKSEQALLEFWEKCNTFQLKEKESNHYTQGWSQDLPRIHPKKQRLQT